MIEFIKTWATATYMMAEILVIGIGFVARSLWEGYKLLKFEYFKCDKREK